MERGKSGPRVVHRRPAETPGPETELDIEHRVGVYSTVFAGVEDGVVKMHGSGTLVTLDGRGCFLTAYHVLFGKGKKRGLLAFSGLCPWVSRHGQQPIYPRDLFSGVSIAAPTMKAGEPDLGALLLPLNLIDAFNDRQKAFYNLDLRSSPKIEKAAARPGALLVVAGAPSEYTQESPRGRVSRMLLGYGRRVTVSHRHGFAYLSLRVYYGLGADPPRTFEGMSGGGVWVVSTRSNSEGVMRVSAPPILVGVVFRQVARRGRVTSVRCHGPEDVYVRTRREISKVIRAQPLWRNPGKI